MMRWTIKAKWMLLLAGVGVALMALACSMAGTRAMIGGQQLDMATGQEPVAEKTSFATVASLDSEPQRAINQATQDGKTGGILVSGQGSASAAPDLAIVRLGVEATGETIKEARSSAASALGMILDTLLEREIDEEDIQTSRLSIHPRYSTRTITKCPGAEGTSSAGSSATTGMTPEIRRPEPEGECYTERQSVITGYEVNNQLVVRLRDLDAVGDVIDEITDAGGDLTRFQGISFSLEDQGPLQDKALTAAIEDAQAKAAHVAKQSGVTLGDLIRISEGSTQPGAPYPSFGGARFAMLESEAYGGVPTSIEGGLVTVGAAVQAVYDIE